MGEVNITLGNGALGATPATNDGVAALEYTATGNGVTLNSPFRVFSLEDAIAQGVIEEDEPGLYRQVNEFYQEAPAGTELWIMGVADTVLLVNMATKTYANGLKKILDAANGRVRIAAIGKTPAEDYDVSEMDFIDDDVKAAVAPAELLVEEMRSKYSPIRMIIEGRVIGDAIAELYEPNTEEANGVSIVLGGSVNDGSASIGAALGRLASIHVQRNLGAVEDGKAQITGSGYIGTKTVDELFNASSLTQFVDAGYITLIKYAQKPGYYWSDDPTAVAVTDDYSSFARGRVIDKAYILTYQTYTEKINTDVLIANDGTIDAGVAKSLEGLIENVINTAMAGEISGVKCFIDVNQNILSTNQLNIVIRIRPKGYLKDIEVLLGFENPALAA